MNEMDTLHDGDTIMEADESVKALALVDKVAALGGPCKTAMRAAVNHCMQKKTDPLTRISSMSEKEVSALGDQNVLALLDYNKACAASWFKEHGLRDSVEEADCGVVMTYFFYSPARL